MAEGRVVNAFVSDVKWQIAGSEDFALTANDVHIWRIRISENTSLIPKLSTLLTDAEKVRGAKYIQERDRHRFMVSRGAQRIIISKYLSTAPHLLEFGLGDNKKPCIINADDADLQFNVSHSGDWILLAVSKLQVGADVEYIDPDFDFDDILPEHFSTDEAAYIIKQDKTERFYKLWTRKESLLKATGQGLGEHLKHTPALNGEHKMHSSLLGNDINWNITTFNIADDHIGSIAVQGLSAQLQFWGVDLGGVILH